MSFFSSAELVEIRRHCGYGSIGSSNSSFGSYRFFQSWGLLEFRMNNLSIEEYNVAENFLANLTTLEIAVYGASANLDTDQAAVWHHNKDEVKDRKGLYDLCRRELCGFLGIEPGPYLKNAGLTLVV